MHFLNLIAACGIAGAIAAYGFGTDAQTVANERIAQQNPASTYQPGFWQPVARVNFNNPVTANIVNRSGIPIEYSLTTSPMGTRALAEGGETRLEGLSEDTYIIINPKSTSRAIQFEIGADNNIVNVTVIPSSDVSGESTVHIHPTGAIYKY